MRNGKHGFTLVELLVVIAIIGTLTALILPAVNSARNAARQTECINNIRQVASAMQIFASSKGYMPPYAKAITTQSSTHPLLVADFVYTILPMMEQGVLRDEIDNIASKATGSLDQDGDGYMDMFSQSAQGAIQLLACPSNPSIEGAFKPSYTANGGHRDPAQTNEWVGSDRANGALSLSLEDANWSAAQLPQPLSFKTTLDYISSNDGTAQTIVVSENVRFSAEPNAGWLPRVGMTNLNDYRQRIEHPRTFWWHAAVDGPPYGDGAAFTSSPEEFPGFLEEVSASGVAGDLQRSSPYSYHSGGFVVGYADGHVSFISNQIGYRIYAKLLTSNGRASCAPLRNNNPVGYFYQDRALSADDIN